MKTRDDKREHDIDANKSTSKMLEDADQQHGEKPKDQPAEQENGVKDDAMTIIAIGIMVLSIRRIFSNALCGVG